MESSDYEGVHKYKWIAICLIVTSAFLSLFGPILLPVVTEYYHFMWVLFAFNKFITSTISLACSAIMQIIVTKRLENPRLIDEEKLALADSRSLLFAFVIPSYKEEESLLCETIQVLADHPQAKDRYLVFLAMEGHEQGSDAKAASIISKFKTSFKLITFSLHQLRPHQSRGKASNVSWCVEHMQPIFSQNNIPKDQVMLTIMDSDSWAPKQYVTLLEEQLSRRYHSRHSIIFVPPQIFGRNRNDVPTFVRVFDDMHSYAVYTNLFTASSLSFPMSNYTLSYELIKSVGFWDTNADAIGQDMHNVIKCFCKSKEKIVTIPIHASFNQLNVCTGNGYLADIKCKFWQCARHLEGAADIAYTFKRAVQNPLSIKHWILFYSVCEAIFIQITLPFVVINQWIYGIFLKDMFVEEPKHINPAMVAAMLNSMGIVFLFLLAIYEYLRQYANKKLFKLTDRSIIRAIVESMSFYFFNFLLFLIPATCYACFKILGNNREYVVAAKYSSSGNNGTIHPSETIDMQPTSNEIATEVSTEISLK